MTGACECGRQPVVGRGMCRRCYGREYYRNNAEYRERLKEQKRQKSRDNPGHRREYNAKYQAENRERITERKRADREANPEKFRAWKTKHRLNNLGAYAVHASRRRARVAAAEGDFQPHEWEEVQQEHDFTCFYCGDKPHRLTIEHRTPLSRGGTNSRDNIVPSCKSCNCSKGTKTEDEFRLYLKENRRHD